MLQHRGENIVFMLPMMWSRCYKLRVPTKFYKCHLGTIRQGYIGEIGVYVYLVYYRRSSKNIKLSNIENLFSYGLLCHASKLKSRKIGNRLSTKLRTYNIVKDFPPE